MGKFKSVTKSITRQGYAAVVDFLCTRAPR